MPKKRSTLEELVKTRYIVNEDGCWVWTGSVKKNGYGQFKYGGRQGKMMYPHRVMYELMVGIIPSGLELDHLCRNKLCINPQHLEPVTHRENVLRGISPPALCATKTHCPHGHEYNQKNTYVRPDGKGKFCIVCSRGRWHKK